MSTTAANEGVALNRAAPLGARKSEAGASALASLNRLTAPEAMALERQMDHQERATPRPNAQRVGDASSVDPKPHPHSRWERSVLPFHGGETAREPYETTSTTPPQEFFQSLSTSHFGVREQI